MKSHLCCNFPRGEDTIEINLEQISKINLRKEKERECLIKIMRQFLFSAFKGMQCEYINVFRDLLYHAQFYIKRNLKEIIVIFDLAKIEFQIKDIIDIFDYETIKTSKFNKYLQLKTIYLMEEEEKLNRLIYIHYTKEDKTFGFFLKLEDDLKTFLTCLQILKLSEECNTGRTI